ncbi:MAG: hypothetical protein U9N61_02865 [Euryarchaeota archaeon]|nr:hypothetical protein [Euryarchaeota archaeon]
MTEEIYPRILVGVPLGKYMNTLPFTAFWNIAKRGYPIIESLPPDRCDVQRNIMGGIAANTNATHLCLLDADHIHPQDVVERFARYVIEDREKKVICGFQYRRCAPYNPCVYVRGEDDNYYWVHERPEEELIEVDGVSAASILINVDIFRNIPAPWWRYTYDHANEHKYPGTDGWFSQLMRDNDVRMYCDTTVTSPHLDNTAVITQKTYENYCKLEKRANDGVVYADVKTKINV